MYPVSDEGVIFLDELSCFSAEHNFPCSEWANDFENGFEDDDGDRSEVDDAEFAIAYPLPIEKSAGVDADEAEQDEEDERKVDDDDEVGGECV